MVNSEAFKARIEKICAHYDLSASAFAEEVGVQRSSISHLLSGRNKPSLDFVLKVVKRFPEVNLYWLLNGKGLFPSPSKAVSAEHGQSVPMETLPPEGKQIERIVVCYTDGTFDQYNPARPKTE